MKKQSRKELYHEYLLTEVWYKKRTNIIRRDDNRCRICNSNGILHVHHRCYPKVLGEELDADLITLCENCHNLYHADKSLRQKPKTRPKKQKTKKKEPQDVLNINAGKLNTKVIKLLHSNGLIISKSGINNIKAENIVTGKQR